MNRLDGLQNTMFGLEKSSTDANRFYSVLLDARATKVSANMCDIAEKLVVGEKENAKIALEQLWALKKNLVSEKNGTIDLLIHFYQEKIDVLRAKEEHIRKVAKDSRGLLEEKRKKDEEIASVKQQIGDCRRELTELTTKLEKLSIKEQELLLIEGQLKKELDVNENEIVNGLYEIILAQQENAAAQQAAPPPSDAEQTNIEGLPPPPAATGLSPAEKPVAPETAEIPKMGAEEGVPVSRVVVFEEKPPFPRSVVKTTAGRIIGEYFYDSGVSKDERHYLFNSKFFASVLSNNVRLLRQRADQEVFLEMLQMIQDAYKRISGSAKLHFEVSTNEILNEKSLKQLWLDAKMRSYDELERFCSRLLAKIETMGQNYRTMLKEQMERCLQGSEQS